MTLRIAEPLYRRLKVYCAQHDLAMSDVAEEGIALVLDREGA